MNISITDRGIMAGERLLGGVLTLFVGKQAGGDIAGGLGDIARIGVSAASDENDKVGNSKADSAAVFVYTPPAK